MKSMSLTAMILILLLCWGGDARAKTQADAETEACLAKAQESPDQTQAEAEIWLRKSGSIGARLCRAVASFHRGIYGFAAAEFESIAKIYEPRDKRQAAQLYNKAGLSFMQAEDAKKADANLSRAVQMESHNPDYLLDRATARAANERYWDAIDDANRALLIMPDMIEALQIRARAYVKLGMDSSAKSDFTRIEVLKSMDAAIDKK